MCLYMCAPRSNRAKKLDLCIVMRAWGVGLSEVQTFVRGKRPMASPNRGFCEQLKVWQACGYSVEQIVDGQRRDKAPYVEWKRSVGILVAESS